MKELSHVNKDGKASMVDVGKKPPQRRRATARGSIRLAPATIDLVRENGLAKGDVLATARIAGIQAAKETPHLIPLCHPLPLDHVQVDFVIHEDSIAVTGCAACVAKTGVEMEALTAVSVALLTIYDMCKAVDKNMRIGEIELVEKTKEDV